MEQKQKQPNKDQRKRKQRPNPKQPPQVSSGKSPNLLQNVLKIKATEVKQYKISKITFVLIVLIQFLFVSFAFYNSRTVKEIETAQGKVLRLETQIHSIKPTEEKIRDIIKRTASMEEIEKNHNILAPKVTTFIEKLPSNILLVKSNIKNDEMALTVKTATPLEVSLLISEYFKKDLAREIAIQTATLNKDENTFTTTLEVTF